MSAIINVIIMHTCTCTIQYVYTHVHVPSVKLPFNNQLLIKVIKKHEVLGAGEMRFAVSRFLKLASAQLRSRSYVTRDIGQPTNYTHPETIAPGESEQMNHNKELQLTRTVLCNCASLSSSWYERF